MKITETDRTIHSMVNIDCKIKDNSICEDMIIICEDSTIYEDDKGNAYILLAANTFGKLCNMVASKFTSLAEHNERLKKVTSKKNKSDGIKLKSTRAKKNNQGDVISYETTFAFPIGYFGFSYYGDIGDATNHFQEFYPETLTSDLEASSDIINYNYILSNSIKYDFERGTVFITLETTEPISKQYIG